MAAPEDFYEATAGKVAQLPEADRKARLAEMGKGADTVRQILASRQVSSVRDREAI